MSFDPMQHKGTTRQQWEDAAEARSVEPCELLVASVTK